LHPFFKLVLTSPSLEIQQPTDDKDVYPNLVAKGDNDGKPHQLNP